MLRFVLGLGAGLVLAAAMCWADGPLTGRLDFSTRNAVAGAAMTFGPLVGVLGAAALGRYGGLDKYLSVSMAGVSNGSDRGRRGAVPDPVAGRDPLALLLSWAAAPRAKQDSRSGMPERR